MAEDDPNPQLYCTVECGWGKGAEEAAEANALLIAAAPELLEELKVLLEFAEQYGPNDRASYTDWSGYFESARAAIAKAEGRTP